MHKNVNQFQDHQNRSKRIFLFYILDLSLIVLSIAAALIETSYSRIIIVIFLLLAIVCIIHTIAYSVKNLILAKNLEEYFFHRNYGSSSQKQKQLRRLLDENLFDYFFQPIVNANTGEIFGYEALMRTDPANIDLLPLEILDMASKEGRLYDIEKYTLNNTLKVMKVYSNIFQTKKLFINSIYSQQLTEADYSTVFNEYRSLFANVILEINEPANISETTMSLIHKRLEASGSQLALDDYGTGFSGNDMLPQIKPDYIKIDRSIIKYINLDSKKQTLASNLVISAKANQIKIIAEGVETPEELEYVIGLGVDYIQGYYTARPEKSPVSMLGEDVVQKIQRINYNKFCEISSKKVYETNGKKSLALSEISSDIYYAVVICEDELTLKGDPASIYDIAVLIPDNHSCKLTLDNVTLRNTERPTISLGSNSTAIIHLTGNNQLLNDGIRVCETADLTITGDGNLLIQADRTGRIGIGGSDSQTYGNITLAHTGNIKISCNGNISIGIGGGQNPANSRIHLLSGNVLVETVGYNAISVGSVLGYSYITIGRDCRLKAKSEATKAVGIGNLVGTAHIECSGDLDIRCDARMSANIGVLEDGDGSILIKGGTSSIKFNAQTAIGIGAVKGNMNIHFEDGDYLISGEGRELIGLGDHSGKSQIKINGGVLAIQLFAVNSVMTGNVSQKIVIDSGNIQSDFPEGTILVNSFGTPLISHIITNSDEFNHTIETVAYSYQYHAVYSNRYPFIKVYLPEYSTIN